MGGLERRREVSMELDQWNPNNGRSQIVGTQRLRVHSLLLCE